MAVREQTRSDKLRAYFLVEGILDGLTATPGTTGSFLAWDTQLGISAKARRLADADRKLSELADAGSLRRRRTALLDRAEANTTFGSATAGPDLWGAGLYGQAGDLVRDEIDPAALSRALVDRLAFGLVDRFIRSAAARGGWPLDPPAEIPGDFDARIGERLSLVVPEHFPVWIAREWIQDFYDRAMQRLDALEAATHEPGRPAEADRAALRRMGRTVFLLKLQRPPKPEPVDVGREYDVAAGREHAGRECYCHKAVRDDLARAAALLAALES